MCLKRQIRHSILPSIWNHTYIIAEACNFIADNQIFHFQTGIVGDMISTALCAVSLNWVSVFTNIYNVYNWYIDHLSIDLQSSCNRARSNSSRLVGEALGLAEIFLEFIERKWWWSIPRNSQWINAMRNSGRSWKHGQTNENESSTDEWEWHSC